LQFSYTAAQVALAWVIAKPGITVVLPGAKSPEQIRTNAGASDISLPPEVIEKLDELSQT
jgi:aryl-alcohol dehydrogenase-like predicted oxidoreductase